MPRLVTASEMARELCLPVNKVFYAIRSGRVQPDVVAAGHLLFRPGRARDVLDACSPTISAVQYATAISRLEAEPHTTVDV